MDLVHQPTNLERDIDALTRRMAVQRERITELEAAIDPLQRAFEAFESSWNARLGPISTELRMVRSRCEQLESMVTRVHARVACDPTGILGGLFDERELREVGKLFGITVPDEWFAQARSRSDRARVFDGHEAEGTAEELFRTLRRKRSASLTQEQRTDLRSLYRTLARRYHPDLAQDDDERAFRQEVMHQINHAWHLQSIEALRDLDHELTTMMPGWSSGRTEQRHAWLTRECAQLDTRIGGLQQRLEQLRSSKTMPLWFNKALGHSAISQRERTLRAELDAAQDRQLAVTQSLKDALQRYCTTMD